MYSSNNIYFFKNNNNDNNIYSFKNNNNDNYIFRSKSNSNSVVEHKPQDLEVVGSNPF